MNGQGYIYVRIYEALREAIWEGKYKPGELLPSEEKLGEIYSASRTASSREQPGWDDMK